MNSPAAVSAGHYPSQGRKLTGTKWAATTLARAWQGQALKRNMLSWNMPMQVCRVTSMTSRTSQGYILLTAATYLLFTHLSLSLCSLFLSFLALNNCILALYYSTQ